MGCSRLCTREIYGNEAGDDTGAVCASRVGATCRAAATSPAAATPGLAGPMAPTERMPPSEHVLPAERVALALSALRAPAVGRLGPAAPVQAASAKCLRSAAPDRVDAPGGGVDLGAGRGVEGGAG
ncbi:MAG: hypothetical protein BWY79_01152 [Actinobacteria bacterium ADurb.Bin444]|nr:MAG: hypothetical protein BWY79_01152 [Actinobacteria bacterium ADurb.Bin444]